MSKTLPLSRPSFAAAIDALRRDLLHEGGPHISTMRNHRFALLVVDPKDEIALRREVQALSIELERGGWTVLSISLKRLLLDRIQRLGPDWAQWVIETEQALSAYDPARALESVKEALAPLIEGPDGLAADCAQIIQAHAKANPGAADRTLALIGHAGALFPFFRSSALLRHLDGRTGEIPVVLLYPGTRTGDHGLSFMGVLRPDSDYRPRIYSA